MPRTTITVTEAPFQGKIDNLTFQAADAANGMRLLNPDGRTFLLIKNDSLGPAQITVLSVPDEAARTGDLLLAVPAGGTGFVPPLRPQWWNQRSGDDAGYIQIDFDVDTDVTVAAVRQQL
ncbi:MAG: hypothetical protein ACK4K6_15545 [Pseudarthrobacter sp.]